jgi:aspartate dehydrogenase
LAGVGFDDTQVRLVADPGASGNRHRIEAAGAFGELDFSIVGRTLPGNPRTSGLTAMSAVRFVENQIAGIRI